MQLKIVLLCNLEKNVQSNLFKNYSQPWFVIHLCTNNKLSEYGLLFWFPDLINSSPPNAAYMRQWNWSALVKIMACRLFRTKPLSKPMRDYCGLDP